MASGLLSKKQYVPSAAIRFIRQLLTDLCLEYTRLPLSLSRWLMHSMTYLFLSISFSRRCLFTHHPSPTHYSLVVMSLTEIEVPISR